MDTRATGLPRWSRLLCYAIAIAAFFWLVPEVRKPERLRVFVPMAMAVFLLEGLAAHFERRRSDRQIPDWVRLCLYYGVLACYLVALPRLRQLPKPWMYASILLGLWLLRRMVAGTSGGERFLMIGPSVILAFVVYGWQRGASLSRVQLALPAAYLVFLAAGYAIFRVRHAGTVMRKSTLALAPLLLLGLIGLAAQLIQLNRTSPEPAIPWLTWPLIAAICAVILLVFVLPVSCCLASPVHRIFAKLEYRVANRQWQEAYVMLPEARARAMNHELEWSFEISALEYEGQISMALAGRDAAIRAWQRGLALSEEHDDAVDFRTTGNFLADAYEQAGRWEELNNLLPRLMASWDEAGIKGRAQRRILQTQRDRIPEGFRRDPVLSLTDVAPPA